MMRDFELEEGEAFFLQEHDEQHIDPDRDFSYIDKKIENVLGHYQKDFMGGLSAESLGARFGGYGSFLPMQQHSPALSEQRFQSHVPSKSPQNRPSEQSHPNPMGARNNSLSVKPVPSSSANRTQVPSEPGMLPMDNQLKLQTAAECASNKQWKEPMKDLSKQKSLKVRVKMTSENVLPAIYSNLGLVSPSCSIEDSSSDSDDALPCTQVDAESPSHIIKIMMDFPLPNGELLSPLHDSLVHLTMKENSVETALPRCDQALIAHKDHGKVCLEGKREASNPKKAKVKQSSKHRKLKQMETSKKRAVKEEDQNVMRWETVTENDYSGNIVALPINTKEGYGTPGLEGTNISLAATSGVDGRSEEMGLAFMTDKSTALKTSNMYDKKSEVRCSGIDREKANGVPASASSHNTAVEIVKSVRGKTGKNFTSVSREELSMGNKNVVECRDDETNKFWKQQSASKDKVKEGVLNSLHPKQDRVYKKDNSMDEMASIGEEENFSFMNDVEVNDNHDVNFEALKDCTGEPHKIPKHKTQLKVMPDSQMEEGAPRGKEHLSFMPKKKSRENRIDVRYTDETPQVNVVVGSAAVENEVIKDSVSSKSKRGDFDSQKEMKKDDKVAFNLGPNKKGKDVSSKDIEMGPPERDIYASTSKQKEKSCSKRNEVASNVAREPIGGNIVMENVPVVNMPPAEIVPHDDWVQCDKCQKWRLLPLGMNPSSLPKTWICSMLTWLPGKNKCSVTEEETNDALRALYQPLGPTQVLNNQQACAAVGVRAGAPGCIQHVDVPGQTYNVDTAAAGSKKRNLPKTGLDAARRSGFLEQQHHSGELSSKSQRKLPRDPNTVRKSGDLKRSKFERKREADVEVSGVSKKMKRVHQQSVGNSDPVGLLTAEAKGENQINDPGALANTWDSGKRISKSSLMKVKDRSQSPMMAKNTEIKDPGKRRKLKDRRENITSLEHQPDRVPHRMKNSIEKNSASEHREEKKERKSKTSNFQGKEGSADKGNSKTSSAGGKRSLGSSGDNIHHKKGRYVPEKAFDFGPSEHATTSSSSKVSNKGKAKASEVKCSPIGSISSSPRIYKSDTEKVINKMPISYKESDDLMSSKQLKPKSESTFHEFPIHNEETRDRKSILSRSSGVNATAAVKWAGADITDTRATLDDCNDASNKVDRMNEDGGALTGQHNLVSVDQVTFRRKKAHDLQIGNENFYGVPETEEANGSYTRNVDNVSLRHTHPSRLMSDIESSMKKEISHRAAKSALKEATNLKHSANRMKISGSTVESTELFFQAALKFLHGASLLEPGYSENVRCGEMASTEVYSTTATLCEYCAHEFERCNNLASAALAYKCMEVAYMRVVYCNDLAASRDRMELQMAVRAAPQVESPSSSASDIDNLNNQAANDTMKDGHSVVDHRVHVISAGNRPNFMRLLNFTEDINRAMEASRRSQGVFAAANPILAQAGKGKGISAVKTVLDFSFHDIDGFLHLVRLAMEALSSSN